MKNNRKNNAPMTQDMTEEMVIEINSPSMEKILNDMKIHSYVRGGLIIRQAKISMPLRNKKLLVGDKVILIGVTKKVVNFLNNLKDSSNNK